ncbi:hypothetical protein COY25_02950 [Candidatus Uhrbacteria bacterium CG_4_10_14_0_2_um_filter_41_7]|uniref:DUF302 domain-containing protein n=1 Tax=Candidatus Uhrbacteria bacterium CG_4_9_14_3_um_filter_41_35 TaxID=1975034 RepID=A0A2M7XGS8_9BACT|nr:MAG: hypothetical protein COV92_00485 [Candidatus Uhrbacteria bacterium CG11_big_fil_rev_8_21_14_0_20_41_9]PIZ53830.1 MAG: hypothetical protein COY25_02950 [Candidatus Uhrbacteria bacterium CG_4_10_14_0_2_um_filter_41_7]PJA47090.1 MAG: hypothetical protein CO173_00300 [Candidatus Uhrbacteria bacterium CG_4_9_14_3_um_filter_41_35]
MKNFIKSITLQSNNFDQVVSKASEIIESTAFKILHIHDVKATFASKGIEHENYKIIEFCRAPIAKQVLDIEPLIGLFLPCKMIIFERNDEITVAVFLPNAISDFFNDVELGTLPEGVNEDILKIIDALNNK